ncbi:S-adenosyl-L-methionine-dependent methyltransferase [Gloeophyllum trabeum ATCC 11539]|uniref:DNA (cytosine-5-)-methyltransferase n=1 Tax=Gloeophyllum trabeum (strain ATCC 11539 / FP-39264 / Madison 617) TaxID=670483 RepID=S7RYJ6_GLOTA|nr:S-adenosyl-L-methionine-dependent methyltransferase [Gloeophyllum trabeum ATCC 11539]EPQ59985.1 S-adenosyl-L-methionine-dependent methyltransferase [Gloeophyllum trabeum ATCC 11539]
METPHAWYILDSPSHLYRPIWDQFIRPHRIAQFVLSSALIEPRQDPAAFLEYFTMAWDDILERPYAESDIQSAIPVIKAAISKSKESKALMGSTVVCSLLNIHAPDALYAPAEQSQPRWSGSLDLAVLQPRNQNPTHVTPLIASLASGLFRERLVVVGPPPPRKDRETIRRERAQEDEAKQRMLFLLSRLRQPRRVVRLVKNRVSRPVVLNQPVLRVDDIEYSIGDTIIVPMRQEGSNPPHKFPTCEAEVPASARMTDYFWFAVLVHVYEDRDQIHVRWFHHSSKTLMVEIADPQEIFLTDICDDIPLSIIAGKATVHYVSRDEQGLKSKPDIGFQELMYRAAEGCFREIQPSEMPIPPGSRNPLSDCAGCLVEQEESEHLSWARIDCGIRYISTDFHIADFVLLRNIDGPAHIGQIMKIVVPPSSGLRRGHQPMLKIRMLGRVGDIMHKAPAELNLVKDERHLFFTGEVRDFPMSSLIGVCFVEHIGCIPDRALWLSMSHKHFYVQYTSPTLEVVSWSDEVVKLRPKEVEICTPCYDAEVDRVKAMKAMLDELAESPLRVLDPFAGVGAFALGLEESGCMKLTHAVEISPSAAKTLKRNSPDTTVYNQCANKMLQWAIKRHAGHQVDRPKSIGEVRPLPNPPTPEDIDVIVAGFPCQPHSRLNMFQRADDRKSNLILNLLSWIDFIRPKFCFFENVRGFLSFNLMSYQESRYTVKGGIEMGGLKFLVRALLAMNYQLRFALLQAGHYGAPQTRVRFFIIAARRDQTLSSFPQPTHDFPPSDNLDIKGPSGEVFQQIRITRGTAPHRAVTVNDAINDLPRFDWYVVRRQIADRARTIPQVHVDLLLPYAGLELKGRNLRYECEPKTSYQVWCRNGRREVRDLQHITRVLKPVVVERLVKIPLKPKADYRSLPRNLQEWLTDNPYSATARKGFRPGLYGRIDGDSFFSTTVTNMEPTAKQSWVLHPYCKRTVTVRELARSQGFPDWFTFYAIGDSVKTMHREIGNAVSWHVSMALGRQLRDVLFTEWKPRETEDNGMYED